RSRVNRQISIRTGFRNGAKSGAIPTRPCPPYGSGLKPRDRRQRLRPAGTLLLEQIGKQKREIDRLLGIEPRIAHRVVAIVEVLVGDLANAASAFGHILAGHFEMHTARIGVFGGVDLEEGAYLLEDEIEWPRLVAGSRGDRVPVHRVAGPHN